MFAKSHELSLAYDEKSLQKLQPPLVLQEFVNHGMQFQHTIKPLCKILNTLNDIPCILMAIVVPGGVLFKVYIVWNAINVARRFPLPDVSKCELFRNSGVFHFPRVASAAQSTDDADLDPCIGGESLRTSLGFGLFILLAAYIILFALWIIQVTSFNHTSQDRRVGSGR